MLLHAYNHSLGDKQRHAWCDLMRVRAAPFFATNFCPQARVFSRWVWRSDVLVVGNISGAVRCIATFSSLQVFGAPGTYEIKFAPLEGVITHSLAPAVLSLGIRPCVSGEANVSIEYTANSNGGPAAAMTAGRAQCDPCRQGTAGFDPAARFGCVRCGESSRLRANCTGAAMIPEDGYWHSHPRSPLLHKCLAVNACRWSNEAAGMRGWVEAHTSLTIAQLLPTFDEYVGMQCANGSQVRESFRHIACNVSVLRLQPEGKRRKPRFRPSSQASAGSRQA